MTVHYYSIAQIRNGTECCSVTLEPIGGSNKGLLRIVPACGLTDRFYSHLRERKDESGERVNPFSIDKTDLEAALRAFDSEDYSILGLPNDTND